MRRIDQLRQLPPQQRLESLQKMFLKNKDFFRSKQPAVANLLDAHGIDPFHITITDDFLTITDKRTNELCHPEVGLDKFSEALGAWTNSAWIDLIEGNFLVHPDLGPYSQYTLKFQTVMVKKFPMLLPRIVQRKINLPTLPNGKRFSNPVVFFGLFHGLHIDYYLSRTQLRDAAFIEPEVPRFVLSCYFLDYKKLDERFGGLLLHIGESIPDGMLDRLINPEVITPLVWTRILPGYASEKVEHFLRAIRLKIKQGRDVWHPQDFQIAGLSNTMANIKSNSLVYARPQSLSAQSRIAVIGAGPSLSDDVEWLRCHQDQMVIFAAHSAVSALRRAGIKPDFQFSLDMHEWNIDPQECHQLDPEIPIVTLINDVPHKFSAFKHVLRIVMKSGVYPLRFNCGISHILPTTGNMALGFACYCRPQQIYLFGMDLGFRQADHTHVKESNVYQSEENQRGILGSGFLEVLRNFQDRDPVYSQPYFNEARLLSQKAIQALGEGIEIYNCSDGALIEGTQAKRAQDIALRSYHKGGDVDTIRSMFVELEEGKDWSAPPVEGAVQLHAFNQAVLEALKMPKFQWLAWSQKIDGILGLVRDRLPKKISKNLDQRVGPYFETVQLILDAWYRCLCFTNNAEEWQLVYEAGYQQLKKTLDEFSWPEDVY